MFGQTLAKWLLGFFGLVVIVINAALTAVFGYTYLGAAFGVGMIAAYAGAVYALLIFDLGYITWFLVFKNHAETTAQRALAAILAGAALLGSIMASLNQLAVNSFGLVDLSAYHDTVGMVALVSMLIITTAHILATAAYTLFEHAERIRQKMIDMRADMLEKALQQSESSMQADTDFIVSAMSAENREYVLAKMGFSVTGDGLKRVGKGLLEDSQQDTGAGNGGGLGYKTRNEATGGGGWFKGRGQRRPTAAVAAPGADGVLSFDNGEFQRAYVGRDGLRYAADLIVPPDPGAAWNQLNQQGMIPQGMTYSTFRELHRQDRESRSSGANPTQGGK